MRYSMLLLHTPYAPPQLFYHQWMDSGDFIVGDSVVWPVDTVAMLLLFFLFEVSTP